MLRLDGPYVHFSASLINENLKVVLRLKKAICDEFLIFFQSAHHCHDNKLAHAPDASDRLGPIVDVYSTLKWIW